MVERDRPRCLELHLAALLRSLELAELNRQSLFRPTNNFHSSTSHKTISRCTAAARAAVARIKTTFLNLQRFPAGVLRINRRIESVAKNRPSFGATHHKGRCRDARESLR